MTKRLGTFYSTSCFSREKQEQMVVITDKDLSSVVNKNTHFLRNIETNEMKPVLKTKKLDCSLSTFLNNDNRCKRGESFQLAISDPNGRTNNWVARNVNSTKEGHTLTSKQR